MVARKPTLACCLLALLAPSAARAESITLGLVCITNNSAADAAIGEAQLSVEITDSGVGPNQVKFIFRNAGPAASSITDLYFDDGTLLGIASIQSGPGTSFSPGGSPPNLPGGNSISPAFVTTAGFLADSDAPVQPNGVNPGEQVAVVFNLINNQNFADIKNALLLGGVDGGLRIGIHVQGFAGGGSESFVNAPPVSVPEPASLLLLTLGLSAVGLTGWQRSRDS